MTIEEFEEKIKQIFIDRGWDKEHYESGLPQCSWFIITYKSRYKDKDIKIYRQLLNGYIYDSMEVGGSCDWDEAFEKAISALKELKDV